MKFVERYWLPRVLMRKALSLLLVLGLYVLLTGCDGSVGVGVSVGVPVGNSGYISIGSGRRWY